MNATLLGQYSPNYIYLPLLKITAFPMWWDMKRGKKKVRQKASSNPDRSFQKEYSTLSKSLSREVCSHGRHICNASGQLKQDQVLSKWKGESWNLKNCPLNSQLNYIFQISNKIWNELPHECCFLCSNSAKKCIFQARPANVQSLSVHLPHMCVL